MEGILTTIGITDNDLSTMKEILDAAEEIRGRVIEEHGSTRGHCREAALAVALKWLKQDQPFCLCQGTVANEDRKDDHYWLRIEGKVVDPTADQFGLSDGVLVQLEERVSHLYEEFSFIYIDPVQVGLLLGT